MQRCEVVELGALVVLVVALLVSVLTLAHWSGGQGSMTATALVAVMASLVTGLLHYIMRPPSGPPSA